MLGLGVGIGFFMGGGGSPAWSPTTPSSLVALFDSRVGLTMPGGVIDNGEITQWTDQKSGLVTVENVANTVHLKASLGTLNVPAVNFGGSPAAGLKYTAANILTAGSARTILFAGQTDAGHSEGSGPVFTNRTSDHGQASAFLLSAGVQYFHGDMLTYSGSLVTSTTLVDSPFCSAHVYTGAGNAPSLQINGSTVPTTGGTQGTEDGATGFVLGGMLGTASYTWAGYAWMIAVYNAALGSTDLAAWKAYCQANFGTP